MVILLGSALPPYTLIWVGKWVRADYKKVNATSTDARLASGTVQCGTTAAAHVKALPATLLQ
jgi:hypothetical protein